MPPFILNRKASSAHAYAAFSYQRMTEGVGFEPVSQSFYSVKARVGFYPSPVVGKTARLGSVETQTAGGEQLGGEVGSGRLKRRFAAKNNEVHEWLA